MVEQPDPAAQLFGQRRQQFPVPAHHLGGIGDVVEHRAADDRAVLADVVAAERERGDDAEVPAAAAQRPEQVRMGVLARGHERAVGEHHVRGEQVIDGQAETARQVADPPAQGQPGHPGGGQEPRRRRHPERHRSRGPHPPTCIRRPRARCAPAADRVLRSSDKSITSAPSATPSPAALCPPPRTAISPPWLRANRTHAITSAASRHRTIAAGRLSIMALYTARASS